MTLKTGSVIQTETIQKLNSLIGTWQGKGVANFPTIEKTNYVEILKFKSNSIEPLLFYEQQTWQTTDITDHSNPLHWEAGFLMVNEDGSVNLLNAQNSRRVEILKGKPEFVTDTNFILNMTSEVLAYDERMKASKRMFKLKGNSLTYNMDMATTKVGQIQLHLRCDLKRI